MESNLLHPKSTVRLLQKRSLDGLYFNNPGVRFYKETISCSQSLYKRDLHGHFGCVNAIEFSSDGELIASGGDDRRLLLWNVWKTVFDGKAPWSIDTQHMSNINSCSFDCINKTVATGGSDGQVIVHDIATLKTISVYGLSDMVFCLSADPINSTIIALASDDGKVQILDTRLPIDSGLCVVADLGATMHSVMFNPSEPRFLATANSKHGIALWDVRKPRNTFIKGGIRNCMSVRFNNRGDQLLVLRRRGCPVLYDMSTMHSICKFDYKSYYNACTLKSASFAGLQDEFVMSGSDDFCVYLWKIPDSSKASYVNSEPHMILKGHRSIVNQVRYCPHNQMILSSGVEKLIKMWTPFALPGSTGHLKHSRRYGDDDEKERNTYSHEEYIHMVLRAGSFLSHDYSNGNTDEEPCMIAFFDSLIQREVEQSAEESDNSTDSVKEKSARATARARASDDEEDGAGLQQAAAPRRASASASTSTSTPRNRRAASSVTDHQGTNSRRSTRTREASGQDSPSSSDSASDVDEILSAMYNRYMHSRDQATSTAGPSGKKISNVITQRKHKEKTTLKTSIVPQVDQQQATLEALCTGDLYHRDNTRSMSVLADVIDNFVDNLVASDFSSDQSLSDTNDGGGGGMYGVSSSNTNPQSSQAILPTVNPPGEGDRSANSASISPISSTSVNMSSNFRGAINHSDLSKAHHRERDLYFAPELEAFFSHVSSSSSDSNAQTKDGNGSHVKDQGRSTKLKPFSHRKGQACSPSSDESSESDATTKASKMNSVVNSQNRKKRRKAISASLPQTSSSLSASNFNSDAPQQRPSVKSFKLKIKTEKSTGQIAPPSSVASFSSPQLPHLPSTSSSSVSHPNSSHHKKPSLSRCSNATTHFKIKEKKAVFHAEVTEPSNSNEASCDTKEAVSFKKVKKSKGRKFRKQAFKDSCTSSEDDD